MAGCVTTEDGLPQDSVRAIVQTHDGYLWIGTSDGLARCDGMNFRVYRGALEMSQPGNDQVCELAEDGEHCLWVRTPDGIAAVRDGQWERFPCRGPLLHGPIQTCCADLMAGVWLGMRDGQTWLSTPGVLECWAGDRLRRYPIDPSITSPSFDDASCDRAGALWLTGCFAYPKVVEVYKGHFRMFGLREGMTSTDVRCVAADREGSVWVGTGDHGLVRFKPRAFSSVLATTNNGSKRQVYSVAPGDAGRLWFGTRAGLVLLQNGRFRTFTNDADPADGFVEQSIRSVLEDRTGRLWFGLYGDGLFTLRNGCFLRETAADLGWGEAWTVTALVQDFESNLWIGSTDGLIRRSASGCFSLVSVRVHFACPRILGIKLAPDGSRLLGTDGGGLYHILHGVVAQHLTTRDGLLSDSATPLCVEPDGTLWIDTDLGLNRIRGKQVRAVTTRQGLFDNTAYCLVEDAFGNYWASCNRGIWRVRKSGLNAVADGRKNWVDCAWFGAGDGLASPEANGECQPTAARTADGRLWLPMTRGCATINTTLGRANPVPPQVVIEQVKVDGEIVFGDGCARPRPASGTGTPRLHLAQGRAREMEISYTANSFIGPKEVQYKFRLKGWDKDWQRAAWGRRVAVSTGLQPGDYTFEVEACNSHGVWSQAATPFAFSLVTEFTQTMWFPVSLVCAGVLFGAVFLSWRLRWQHRVLMLEREKSFANERTRTARDLHDDLGTSLTGLALELDVIRADGRDGAQSAQRLAEAASRTRTLAERMREVVWAVNPRCDTVSSLATFLEQQAGHLLRSTAIRNRVEFPKDVPSLPLDGEAHGQLALGVREALTNVIRHSQAGEVVLSLNLEKGKPGGSRGGQRCGMPDVVLMDIHLPGLSGIECVARLKGLLPQTQIIMLTIEEDSEQVFESLKAGAAGYLVKHATPEEILEAVGEVHRGGAPMSSYIARMVVSAFRQPDPPGGDDLRLSRREEDTLRLLARGHRSKEIADELGISATTVNT